MAVAKNPGVGQGRGGGRPKGKASERGEEREAKPVQLRLSPRAVELIQNAAAVGKVRPWRVVELAILAALDTPPGGNVSTPAPGPAALQLPPEALEIAQECAAFLEAQENRVAALKVLRRAWKQALALTRLELRVDP
jgi:hypothetical protein